jgi:hypothetical protein
MNKCYVCCIRETDDLLYQYGDYVYYCTVCNPHKSEKDWTLTRAWAVRKNGKQEIKKIEKQLRRCFFCHTPEIIIDCSNKEHNVILAEYWGELECEFCKYEREVAKPRRIEFAKRNTLPYIEAGHVYLDGWIESKGKKK